MPNLNQCNFIGHVGADPEIRTFNDGNKIATTRIAVSERYTDRNGQAQQNTEWIPIVFSGKLAGIVETYVKKGTPIFVSGKWHTREWSDQSGNKRTSTEVQVRELQILAKPQEQQTAPANNYAPQPSAPAPQAPAPAPAPQYAPQPVYQAPPAPAAAPAPAPAPYVSNDPDLPF